MAIDFETRRIRDKLRFANTLLLFALLMQLPLIIMAVARNFFHYDWNLPGRLGFFVCVVSSLAAFIGFFIAYRQLDLWDDAMENSRFSRVMRPRTFGGMKLAGGILLLFYGLLLIPLFNLPAILWARSRAKAALSDIDEQSKDSYR